MKRFLTLALGLIFADAAEASTSETMKQAEKAPLIINSKKGLVCDKERLLCSAEGDVKVTKGPYEMYSHEAIAFLDKTDKGKLEIKRVEAHNDVRFFGIQGEKATAEDANYDLDNQTIDLTGDAGKRVAVWKDTYIMLCDELKIFFKETPDGKLEVDRIDGSGNVSLSSPEELIEGHKAVMKPATNIVDITGDVRVNRKQGQIRGPHAQVNLDTKVSKMLKGQSVSTDQRVRVLVLPKEVDKNTLRNDKDKGSVS